MSNQHVLKIHPAPLADLLSGAKTAEVRRNDRGFQMGDTVRLMEVNPETGNWTGTADHVRTISHIQTGYGLPDGLCVLSYAALATQPAVQSQASEFQREDRYMVIKRKDLEKAHVTDREWFKNALSLLELYLPKREYLVIESDWPEYEPTWAAIQARVEANAAVRGDKQ